MFSKYLIPSLYYYEQLRKMQAPKWQSKYEKRKKILVQSK